MITLWLDNTTVFLEAKRGSLEVSRIGKKFFVKLRKPYYNSQGLPVFWYFPMRKKENIKRYSVGQYKKMSLSAVIYRPSWVKFPSCPADDGLSFLF